MDRPIGWWLKHLDRLIDDSFEECCAAAGLDRRSWQLLNVLAPCPATTTEVASALEPFWDDTSEAPRMLATLAERGLVERTEDRRWRSTAHGESMRATAGAAVAGIRERMARGVTPEEYRETIDVLSRMAANLSGGTG